MSYLKKLIANPGILFITMGHRGFFHWMSDEQYLKIAYRIKVGKRLNLNPPRTFGEKLQWMKIHDHNPEYTRRVDKYEAKGIAAELIGEKYVVPCYGVRERFEDIDFGILPEQFVLKCAHDSGSFVICKDKATFDFKAAQRKLTDCLRHSFYWGQREWAYKDVKPRIIAEEYIPSLGRPESVEYKLTCFDGKVKLITICHGIVHTDFSLRQNDHFDRDFNRLNFYAFYKSLGGEMERPKELDEIIQISEKLAAGLPEVRVDSYVVNSKVYFGEMTFYTWSGFLIYNPSEWDQVMGDWFTLPEIKE